VATGHQAEGQPLKKMAQPGAGLKTVFEWQVEKTLGGELAD